MRLVADESCDFSVVVGVRGAGHDVIAIAELMSGVDDGKVIDLAASERRLLLTEDKDFGQLVFAAAKQNSGVILIRYPALARSTLTEAVVKLLAERGDGLYSRFVVLEPGSRSSLSDWRWKRFIEDGLSEGRVRLGLIGERRDRATPPQSFHDAVAPIERMA